MKITLDIDCTPAEARAFFGLPDVTNVNAVVTEELERRTRENLDTLADPKAFWDKMMSTSAGGMDAFQALFTQAAGAAAKSGRTKE